MGSVTSINAAHRAEPWMTKAQIARHLKVTTRTVERWQHEGLPFHPVRGVNRYRASEVDGWVVSCSV
jgi:excisionase family DNA binding protein